MSFSASNRIVAAPRSSRSLFRHIDCFCRAKRLQGRRATLRKTFFGALSASCQIAGVFRHNGRRRRGRAFIRRRRIAHGGDDCARSSRTSWRRRRERRRLRWRQCGRERCGILSRQHALCVSRHSNTGTQRALKQRVGWLQAAAARRRSVCARVRRSYRSATQRATTTR